MTVLVSIIVPIYNVEKYIEKCIESLTTQTYSNIEIILIDDGSPDNCGEVCDKWMKLDARITVIHKTNGGLSSARNAGLDMCKGEYIFFVDSDDWIEPDCVESMLNAAVNEKADVVGCSFICEYEETGKSIACPKEDFSGNSEEALALLYDQNRIPVASMKLYSRRIWKELRFPLGKVYEDALTTYKVFDIAERIIQMSETLYHYRIRENSIMTASFSLNKLGICEAWRENYLFCKKKYPSIAPSARAFWLEHLPPVLSQFPKQMNIEERKAKNQIKKTILSNLGYILFNMPAKKVFFQLKALCLP